MRQFVFMALGMVAAATALPTPTAAAPPAIRERIDRLVRIVRTDRSFKIRALAARRLGALAKTAAARDPVAIDALLDCLGDGHEVVRGVCAQALGAHRAPRTLPDLERLALKDDDEVVRRAARRAADKIRPESRTRSLVATKSSRPLTVTLGRVEIDRASGLARPASEVLLRTIRTAIEDRLEPHRPAMMPREEPDLRIDVVVTRHSTGAQRGRDIRFEVRVVLVELPGANLRTTAQAIATTRGARRSAKRMEKLERRIALEAVNRAVDEALVTLVGG